MNPLGDAILAVFGLCTVVVLMVSIALRTRRHPIAASTLAGLLCWAAIYGLIAAAGLLAGGTGRFGLAWWLLLVGAGMVPAAAIGLAEGLVASIIVRQFSRLRA